MDDWLTDKMASGRLPGLFYVLRSGQLEDGKSGVRVRMGPGGDRRGFGQMALGDTIPES